MKKGVIILLLIVSVAACTDYETIIDDQPKSTRDLAIPDDFEFRISETVQLSVLVQNADYPLSNVPIRVYFEDPGTNEEPNADASFSKTLVSDEQGSIQASLEIPLHINQIYLYTNYLGLPRVSIVPVEGSLIDFTYGESTVIEPVVPKNDNRVLKSGFTYLLLGSWDNYGVPTYLEPERDQISQALLNNINASLPERKALPESHPSYLEAENQSNIIIKEAADVWVTFVHEGAGYKNTLGFYVYDQDNPPVTKEDIEEIKIIFPNVSFLGSGGGLRSGDKVHLGQFEPGQTLGWVILANGYSSSGNFKDQNIYFSDRRFNPEISENRKQHMVLLHDDENDLLLIGFEDLQREDNTDDDFNDAVFYVAANPITAIDVTDIPSIDTPEDKDNDGVSDTFDDYPDDPSLAYNNHYPAENRFGTIVAEDLWPAYGDFDFNDLVLQYHFHNMADPNNRVVKMAIDIRVMAIGASYRNGFGIELPISPSLIKSVSGLSENYEYVNLSSNGTESRQSNAVIVLFEDAYQILPFVGNGSGVNTVMSDPKSEPQTISIVVEFTRTLSLAELGPEPYNPFIIIDGERGKEIHLPGKQGTDLADSSYFGGNQDDTNPSQSKYYQSEHNLPWVLNIPSEFLHPQEKQDIIKGYNKFANWATSGGVLSTDWYTEKEGNRDLNLLYTK
ncbi:MAG: LruC domain-containing protein [Bacteroidota bacterium]|nr:LruC domain-containing protein [Bacteroidota bacterium]